MYRRVTRTRRNTNHWSRRTARVLGAAAVLLLPGALHAQCDADKIRKAAGGASGYRKVAATLCEGIYGKDVSGAVLTLVSLTEPAYLDSYEPVRMRWSGPSGVTHLRAQSWSEQAFQMDASTDGTALEWGVDLLRRENIPLHQVGLLAWVDEGDDRVYVPLRVAQESDPEPDTDYVFQVLPNARLREVAVTLAPAPKAGERPTMGLLRDQEILPQTRFPMAEAIEIWIPRSELAEPGVYFIEIAALQVDDTSPDTVSLWFYHGG